MTQANKKILHTVLEKNAERFPHRKAVEHGGRSITYETLHAAADRLALELQTRGARQNTIVALYLENSIEFIAALLGVMKAGAVFMPLDTSFPPRRIDLMLGKTSAEFLLTDAALKSDLEGIVPELQLINPSCQMGWLNNDLTSDWSTSQKQKPELQLINPTCQMGWLNNDLTSDRSISQKQKKDHANKPQCLSQPDDANYIFFSSGTTGEPKAITGCHKSLSHFVHWEAEEFCFDENTRITQLAPVSFDACLKDIFTPMLKGGTVCIPERGIRNNTTLLLDWINDRKITVVHCVPSLFRTLLTEMESRSMSSVFLKHLKYLILAGDVLYGRDVNRWMDMFKDRIELINLYGPTETTLIKTCHRIRERPVTPSSIMHVGQPISNTAVLIIKGNRLCEIGEIGDIYIKTPFMTKGYYGDTEMTRVSFMQNPIQNDVSEIVYRTGDLGRYLPDRSVEFVGRLDNQVKVNGIRMDLSEIEQSLAGMQSLGQAIVQTQRNNDNENVLVCYYIEKEPTDSGMIRDYLAKNLPPYMLPAHFLRMDELPLNLNGKINRKALPKPEELLYSDTVIVEPDSDEERALAAIWQDVLGVQKVSVKSPFFEIGGHSLKAIQIVSRIYKEFKVEIRLKDFFEHPTIREQVLLLNRPETSMLSVIEPAPQQADYELSHAQKRLWILSQIDAGGISYSMPGVYVVHGPLEKFFLETGFQTLITRHESLRTTFKVINGEPRQLIHPGPPNGFHIHEIELEGTLPDNASFSDSRMSDLVKPHVEAELRRPFDLTRDTLIRLVLIRLTRTRGAGDRHFLVFNMHHIIGDGWSVDVIARELFHLYANLVEKQASPLPDLRIQYKDFSVWQNRILTSEATRKLADYWHEKLSGSLPILDLPLDYPRPPVSHYRGRTEFFAWDHSLLKRLTAFSQEHNVSLFMTLLTGVKILMYRYTGQTDSILGTPMAGREHPDLENQVGFYVNTLALRDEVIEGEGFGDLLARVKQTTLDAYEHQAYPFDRLVDELDVVRDVGRAPVFDVMVVFQGHTEPEYKMGDITFSEMDFETGTSKFDLTFIFRVTQKGLMVGVNYNTDLFKQGTVRSMASHLKHVIQSGLKAPDLAISDIDLLDKNELNRLNDDARGPVRSYPNDQSLVKLFNLRAEEFKDRVAVSFEDRQWTYKELNRVSTDLALHLAGQYGIRSGDMVGLMMDRNDESVFCLIAILKAGGVCVPMDTFYPPDRIRLILKKSDCKAVLVNSLDKFQQLVSEGETLGYHVLEGSKLLLEASGSVKVHDLPPVGCDDPAWVFYTSGSTGTPKGVLLEHKGYVNMAMGLIESYEISPEDRILQCVSYAFDVSMSEIFAALLSGASLVVATRSLMDHPVAFADYLIKHEVTVAMLTPLYVNALGKDGLKSLRVLITGGESPEIEDALYHSRHLAYFNGYGPTESSVYAALHRIDPQGDYSLGIPLGKPMPNTSIHILDVHQKPVPLGVSGEICISGIGLARNYLREPAMTAERFITNPFGEGRLYKTGDLGRRLSDGSILFLGRRDEQIKIRGHRVEPGEIESRLQQYPGIEKAVVIKIDSLHQLAAYLVVSGDIQNQELKAHLASFLPNYMIPSFFTQVAELPLSPTGKVDKKALPVPQISQENSICPVSPRTPIETALLSIFQEILDSPSMGIFDHFFDLGGTSLSAVKCVARVFHELQINVSAKELFLNPTVASFAGALICVPNTQVQEMTQEICTETTSVTIESRSLVKLIHDKLIKPIDAAALEYLPVELLKGPGDKASFLKKWCENTPVLSGIIETSLGRIGLFVLPLFNSDLFQDEKRVVKHVLNAMELAGSIGARVVSMTGLLPWATRQALAVTDCITPDHKLPSLTTGQASVCAIGVIAVENLLADAGRSMSEEHLGVIGCDMQVQALLKLMLDVLPHPGMISLSGVYQDKERLNQLTRELSSDSGFCGNIRVITAKPQVPSEFYEASLMIGATGITDAICVQDLKPGTLLLVDPARPFVNEDKARQRYESKQDILFAQGDVLVTPAPHTKLVYLTESMKSELPREQLQELLRSDPNTLTGCILSGLLSFCDPAIPVVVGDVGSEICRKHLTGIHKLGFGAAISQCREGGKRSFFLDTFREHFATVKN